MQTLLALLLARNVTGGSSTTATLARDCVGTELVRQLAAKLSRVGEYHLPPFNVSESFSFCSI